MLLKQLQLHLKQVFGTLKSYATKVGLAFQVWDDVLDVIGDTKVMGKTQGADISLDKSTYPALMGIEKAHIQQSKL